MVASAIGNLIIFNSRTEQSFRLDIHTHISLGLPYKETEYLVLLIIFIIGCYNMFSFVIVFIYSIACMDGETNNFLFVTKTQG